MDPNEDPLHAALLGVATGGAGCNMDMYSIGLQASFHRTVIPPSGGRIYS